MMLTPFWEEYHYLHCSGKENLADAYKKKGEAADLRQ